MDYVRLGSSGLPISKLILGGAGFGDITDADTARRLIDVAFDHGVNTFDTSNVYNGGLSEEFIGRALSGRRDRAVILTKAGFRTAADNREMTGMLSGGLSGAEHLERAITPSDYGLNRRNLFASIDASLRRLRTDRIDVFQLHYWDATTPVEEMLDALDDLVRLGKVCYVGCSSVGVAQLEALTPDRRPGSGIQSVQAALSLLAGYREPSFGDTAAGAGVSVLAFGVLAAGLLSKRFDPEGPPPGPRTRFGSRPNNARMWNPTTLATVARFDKVARSLGRSMVEVAQGHALALPGVDAVIAGASTEAQLVERIDAIARPLSVEELAAVTAAQEDAVAR